jgi:hypothetical protein
MGDWDEIALDPSKLQEGSSIDAADGGSLKRE